MSLYCIWKNKNRYNVDIVNHYVNVSQTNARVYEQNTLVISMCSEVWSFCLFKCITWQTVDISKWCKSVWLQNYL